MQILVAEVDEVLAFASRVVSPIIFSNPTQTLTTSVPQGSREKGLLLSVHHLRFAHEIQACTTAGKNCMQLGIISYSIISFHVRDEIFVKLIPIPTNEWW